jgi:hypothetical protein
MISMCFEICAQRSLVPSFVAGGVCDLRMHTDSSKLRHKSPCTHEAANFAFCEWSGPGKVARRCGLCKTGVLEHSQCRQSGNWREDNANVGPDVELELELGSKFSSH